MRVECMREGMVWIFPGRNFVVEYLVLVPDTVIGESLKLVTKGRLSRLR
jgi:hypothetical protein